MVKLSNVWKKRVRLAIYSLLICGLYGVSLFLPVAPSANGWFALMFAWAGPGILAWSANIVLYLGWGALLFVGTRLAVRLGIASGLLALCAPLTIYGFQWSYLQVGYYVWLGSCIALTLTAIVEHILYRHPQSASA